MSKTMDEDFFAGKPAWFRGYAETITNYILSSARVCPPNTFRLEEHPAAVHLKSCSIATIHNVDEDVDMEDSFSTFGGSSNPVCYLSTVITCACGQFTREHVSITSTISEALSSALFVSSK